MSTRKYLRVGALSSVLSVEGREVGNCAGIDWVSEKHDVLIADEAGEELLAATFPYDENGIASLCRAMVRDEVEVVAIERPDRGGGRAAAGGWGAGVGAAPQSGQGGAGSVSRLRREVRSV